jgi:hypothetical protein
LTSEKGELTLKFANFENSQENGEEEDELEKFMA